MPTIDERVVKLSLDDSQFDKASDRTISKLDELKKSLDFNGTVDGFKEIEKAVKQTDFSPMEKGVQAVANQFNALYTIADQFIRLQVNKVVNSIESTINSLTFDNISAGWDKYAQKTSAVQTIMASTADQFSDTAVQMEFVEGQLEKLNWFTDETSYKFLDMANNIGKFTANEVGLEDSVTAMQGISNWAAISGAGIRGASMAMYNLAQAISMGSLKLQDWRSIELANMGTSEFKRVAMEAGEAAGTLVKVADGVYRTVEKGTEVTTQSFRNSLSEAWLTTDVLMATLKEYGDFTNELYKFAEETDLSATPLIRYINEYKKGTLDLEDAMVSTGMSAEELRKWLEKLSSDEYDLGRRAFAAAQEAKTFQEAIDAVKEAVSTGWSNTFENIFGNYEEAKKLWSDFAEGLYEVFVESSNMRNGILRDWKAIGGRTYLIEGLYKLFGKLRDSVFFFKETIEEIFPMKTAEQLKEMSKGFSDFMALLTPSENTIESIHNVLTLLLTIMQKVGQVGIVIFAGLEPIWGLLIQIGSAVIGLAGDISKLFGLNLEKIFSADHLTNLYNIIYAISSLISALARGALIEVVSILGRIIRFGEDIYTTFANGEGGVKGFIDAIIINFSRLFDAMSGGNGIKGIINNIIFSIQDLYNSVASGDSIFSKLFNAIASIAKVVLGPVILLIESIFGSFDAENIDSNPIVNFFKDVGSAVSESKLIDNIGVAASALLQFVSDIIGGVDGLRDAGKNLHEVLKWLMDQFGVLWDWFIEELTKLSFRDVADVMVIIFIAELIQAFVGLTNAAKTAVTGFSGILTSVRQVIDTFSGRGLDGMARSISDFLAKTKYLQMAIALGVLTDGLMKLSEVDSGKLGTAVASITVVMGLLAALMTLMKKLSDSAPPPAPPGGGNGTTINIPALNSMLQFAIGLRLLVSAVSVIGDIIDSEKSGIARYESIIAGLIGLGLVMAEVGAFSFIVNKLNLNTDLTKAAATLSVFALAISAMVIPVALFSFFDWEGLMQGLLGTATLMISFAGAAKIMGSVNVKPILVAAGAMSIMAIGLTALSVPVIALSLIDLAGLAKGVVSVTIMLAALTAACIVISKWGSTNAGGMLAAGAAMISFSAAVIVLSGAMKVIEGISWDGIAKGIAVIVVAFLGFAGLAAICTTASIGLLALAAVIISVGASFALFAIGVKTLVDAVAEFVVICGVIMAAGEVLGDDFPAILNKALDNVELVFRGFLSMIPRLAQDLAQAATVLISSLAIGVIAAAPDILNGLLVILTLVLNVIGKSAGPIAHAIADIFDGLAQEMPLLLDAAGRFIEELIAGLGVIFWDALIGLIRFVLSSLGFKKLADMFGDAMHDVGNDMVDGLAIGLEDGKDEIHDAGSDLMNSALGGMKETADINSPSGITEMFGHFLGEGFVDGINDVLPDFENSGFLTMEKYFSGMTTGIEKGGKEASDLMDSILRMLGAKTSAVKQYTKMSEESFLRAQIKEGKIRGDNVSDLEEKLANLNKTSTETTSTITDLGTSFATSSDSISKSASKTGSSAEKVQTAAEKIAESYKSALDEIDYLDKKYKGEYDLWSILNIDVKDIDKKAAQLEYTNKQVETQVNRTQIAQEKYEKIVKAMGKTSQEARDAEVDWIEQQVKLATLQNEIVEIQNDILADAARQLELQEKNAELTYNLWVSSNKHASQSEQLQKQLAYTMQKLEYSANKVTEARENYNEALEKYGEDSTETLEAMNAVLEIEKDYQDLLIETNEIQQSITELESERMDLMLENRNLEYDIWVERNKQASDEEKMAKRQEYLMSNYMDALDKRDKAWYKYFLLVEAGKKETIEAEQAYQEFLNADMEAVKKQKELVDNQITALEEAEDRLTTQKGLTESMRKLWEAVNEGASTATKRAKEASDLSEDLVSSYEELLILGQKMNKQIEEYGEGSNEAVEAQAKYYDKLTEIQEILKKQKDLQLTILKDAQANIEFEKKRLQISDTVWQTTNKYATETEKNVHNLEKVQYELVLNQRELNNLTEQYNYLVKRYGKESEEARDAWYECKEKMNEVLELQNERKELFMEMIDIEASLLDIVEKRASLEKSLWEALNQDATDSEKQARNMTYQMQLLEIATDRLRNASKKYNYALKVYGEDAKETQELFNAMLEAQVSYAETYNELKSLQQEIITKNNDILEQLDYSEKLLDYGYNIWEKLFDDISDAQKIEAEISKLGKDLTLQVQRANYYAAEWKKAVAKYGQNSAEAQEAYLNYLEALYKAVDLQSSLEKKETDLTDLRAENAKKLQEAWDEVKAKDLVGGTSIYDELVEMGLSEAEIEAYVKEKAGIIEDTIGAEMDFSIENMQSKAEESLRQWGLTWVDGVYDVADDVVTTAGDCMSEMTDIIAEGVEEGIALAEEAMAEVGDITTEGTEEVVDTVDVAMRDLINTITSNTGDAVNAMQQLCNEVVAAGTRGSVVEEYHSIGRYMTMGIGQGILNGKWSVIDSIIQVIEEAIWWANKTAEIRSPSRKTMWTGEMLDAGVIKGIENRAGEMAKTMASAVQNGINAMRNVAHTSNTLDYIGGLIYDGITGGIDGYSYNIVAVGKEVLNTLADEYDEFIDDMIGENQWLIDALRDYGFDETTHGIEFVVNLDATDAKTQLESLFDAREADLEYYDELLDMQERNAQKSPNDLATAAEAQAIQRELNRVLSSIESYEQQIEDIVNAGRVKNSADSIASKKTEYIQNIYSTKPLSPLDIYRNTNSLLLRFSAWR